jgi:hypothetical protein
MHTATVHDIDEKSAIACFVNFWNFTASSVPVINILTGIVLEMHANLGNV